MILLDSSFKENLIAVIAGGGISLLSLFLVEQFKRKQHLQDKKKEIFQKLCSNISRHQSMIKYEVELLVTINMHKRAVEIAPSSQSSDLHNEEYRKAIGEYNAIIKEGISVTAEFDDLIASYKCYFPKNIKVESILAEQIDNKAAYEKNEIPDYNDIKDYNTLMKQGINDIEHEGRKIKTRLLVASNPLIDSIKSDIPSSSWDL